VFELKEYSYLNTTRDALENSNSTLPSSIYSDFSGGALEAHEAITKTNPAIKMPALYIECTPLFFYNNKIIKNKIKKKTMRLDVDMRTVFVS
jgi:hypothetical protein